MTIAIPGFVSLPHFFVMVPFFFILKTTYHKVFKSHRMTPKPSPGSSSSCHSSDWPWASLPWSSSSEPGSIPINFLLLRPPCPWRGRAPWWWGWWRRRRREHLSRLPRDFQKQLAVQGTFWKPAQVDACRGWGWNLSWRNAPDTYSYYCSLYRKRVMLTEKDLGKDCKDHVYCTWGY